MPARKAQAIPLHIALIDPSLYSPEYDTRLAHALGALGHDVTLITRPPRPDEPVHLGRYHLLPHFYRRSERLRVRFPRSYRYLKLVEHVFDSARLPRTIRRLGADVIHLQWTVVPIVDRWALRRLRTTTPLVMTLHNTTPYHGDPRSRVQSVDTTRVLREFDAFVVHTEGGRTQAIVAGLPPGHTHVIPHGLLPSDHAGGSRPAADRAMSNDLHLLLFGKIRPYKGVDVMIRALGELPPQLRHRVTVTIAGNPEQPMEPLLALAADLDVESQIRWELHFLSDEEVSSLFHWADAVVLPYRDIDASGVFMKALAEGVPVIATQIGIFRELVKPGSTGLLFEPDDAGGLAECVKKLVDDPNLRAALASEARNAAEEIPSWEEIARRTAAVYEDVLSARRTDDDAVPRLDG